MQADRVQVLVQQAAAGNVEAFVALVQEFAPSLRLVLAAHLDQPSALVMVELAVWSAVRTRLGEWLPDTPFPEWIQQVSAEPVATHLAQADRRAIDIQDALSHQIIEHCREALADGSELGIVVLPQRLAALPDTTRTLLLRRYRERQRPAALAASLMISESELATSLAAARAACDWTGLANPPGPGDRLIPSLVEDWLNGTIDVDSRALLATNLGRDLERARQFARQVRLHLALNAALVLFTREDAITIARQTGIGAGDSGRVMMGEAPRTTSDPRRPARMTTSNQRQVPLDVEAPRPSPMPWIIGGGMVLVGIFAVVVMSLGSGTRKIAPARPVDTPPAPTVLAPASTTPSPVHTPPPAPSSGGVLRVNPGKVDLSTTPPKVILLGITAGGHGYPGVAVEFRALTVNIPNLTEVEYWAGDQRIGSAKEVPYSVTWTPSRTGAVLVHARAMTGSVTKMSSESLTFTVVAALGHGQFTREWWIGLPGDQVAEGLGRLTSSTVPAGRALESQFAAPQNWAEEYLQRMSGFITPPLNGEYVFWICADNEAELWLSTDDTREQRKRIAVSPWTAAPYQAWNNDPRQRSEPITLRAGQRYYIEALHKEGVGADVLDVGWQLPDGQLERPIPGIHLTPAPPTPTPTGPAIAPVATTPPPPPPPGVEAGVVLWDGETKAEGFGYSSANITKVAGSGRSGGMGLQATLTTEFANLGWNWFAWFPDDAGSDVRSATALGLWLRFEGANLPTQVSLQFLSGPKSVQARSASIDLVALVPSIADGQWHQVVIPLERLTAAGFDLAKVWEFNLKCQGRGVLAATVSIDDIAALQKPAATTPAPAPTPAPPAAIWKVVRAINLGGETTEIDGVRFIGQRQAEADGATPAGSHQPGPWLDELAWTRATNANGEVHRNRNWENNPLSINGKVYAHGLGMHAASEVIYALDGKYSGFTATVGMDDAANEGEAIFQVWVDGQKAFDSGAMRKGAAKPVAVPLTGRKELRLVVDPNGGNDWDHADWANAQLLTPGGNDGVLQVQAGRRATTTFAPKPAVDAKTRALLGTALGATKEGLSFRVKVPNGLHRVWLWVAENGAANSRQFDLTVEGQTLTGVGLLPANSWEKLGPIEVTVTDGTIDVAATVLKGIPQVMGILVEQSPSSVAIADRLVVDDFERDAPEWGFVGGGEFPGAKGMAVRDTGTAHGGTGAYRLDWDFTGGGVYVGTWRKFETVKVPDVTELRFWVKTTGLSAFGVRLSDGSGQLHQSSVRLAATTEWQEVVLKIAQAVGGEHWDGANDGRWHPPIKGLGLNVGKDRAAVTGSVWIDDLTWVVAPAAKP